MPALRLIVQRPHTDDRLPVEVQPRGVLETPQDRVRGHAPLRPVPVRKHDAQPVHRIFCMERYGYLVSLFKAHPLAYSADDYEALLP